LEEVGIREVVSAGPARAESQAALVKAESEFEAREGLIEMPEAISGKPAEIELLALKELAGRMGAGTSNAGVATVAEFATLAAGRRPFSLMAAVGPRVAWVDSTLPSPLNPDELKVLAVWLPLSAFSEILDRQTLLTSSGTLPLQKCFQPF
jgi:hypothetical protein